MTTACILGAGFSVHAGLPLAAELFDGSNQMPMSRRALIRLDRVDRAFENWRKENPGGHAEQFIRACYESKVTSVPFPWIVEAIGNRLATAHTTSAAASPRYLNQVMAPLGIPEYVEFWSALTVSNRLNSVLSFNYDLIVERTLRHRTMKRPKLPGVYYGGVSTPQPLSGSSVAPWRPHRQDAEMSGQIALFKLHGSVNWSTESESITVWCDARPCFRSVNQAAIVPPMPEKSIPRWLHNVWSDAEAALKHAKAWLVCGYSIPDYDRAALSLFKNHAKYCSRLIISDPSDVVVKRWRGIVPHARITVVPRFPDCVTQLRSMFA